jgi:hypothetical protein
MSDDTSKTSEPAEGTDSQRTKQISTVGWTAGFFAIVACCVLANTPSWPMAAGVAALSVMMTVICIFMLKK